jgi:WD40 repeat protein
MNMSIIKNVFGHLFGWSFVGIDDIDAALPRFLVFTRDGKSLVSAGHHTVVRIWDIASGKTVRTIRGQVGDRSEGTIYAAALSPDERSGCLDPAAGRHDGSSEAIYLGKILFVDFRPADLTLCGVLGIHRTNAQLSAR